MDVYILYEYIRTPTTLEDPTVIGVFESEDDAKAVGQKMHDNYKGDNFIYAYRRMTLTKAGEAFKAGADFSYSDLVLVAVLTKKF